MPGSVPDDDVPKSLSPMGTSGVSRRQNVRFAELQARLRKQELGMSDLTAPYLWIVLIAVLGACGYIVFLVRDGNADAARTLDNAVAVLPALRRSLHPQLEGEKQGDDVGQLPATAPRD